MTWASAQDLRFVKSIAVSDESHGTRKLVDHLMGVHDVLVAWECDKSVCRAGLFHSVLGTSSFGETECDEATRQAVLDHLGEVAGGIVTRISTSSLFTPLHQPLNLHEILCDASVSDVWVANFVDIQLNDGRQLDARRLREFLRRAKAVEYVLCAGALEAVAVVRSYLEANAERTRP